MAKYLGTYANKAAAEAAVLNNELNRPFVAYTLDKKEVFYGPSNFAKVGDIVVAHNGLLYSISQIAYNTTDYPASDYIPVGIVVIAPQAGLDATGTEKATIMSLNFMDYNNPEAGSVTEKYMYPIADSDSYYSTVNNTILSSSFPFINSNTVAITDFDGKQHTQFLLNLFPDDLSTSTISNTVIPAEKCASRYHTAGTSKGDWYIPAGGEISSAFRTNTDIINAGRAMLGLASVPSHLIGSGIGKQYSAVYPWCAAFDQELKIWMLEPHRVQPCLAFAQFIIEPLA